MAERSVCGGCSKPATFFCLCTSVKTLLCPLCIPAHVSTRGAHLISPISAQSFVKKPEDLDRYNTRLHVVEELTSVLDEISKQLDIERKSVSAVISEVHSERVKLLKTAFVDVQRNVEELYAALKTSVQAIRDEIMHASSVSTIELSQQTQLFVSSASHIREKSTPFVDVMREIDQRISLNISRVSIDAAFTLPSVLTPWVCKSRDCFSCSEIRKGLDIVLATPPPPPLPAEEPAEELNIFAKLFGAKVKAAVETISPEGARRKPGETSSSYSSVSQSQDEKPNKSYFL